MKSIYLDNNSTTVTDPQVASVMMDCYQAGFVNPASQHLPGQKARQSLEDFRDRIIDGLGGCSVGMDADQLILTSGGTESNNLAICGMAHHVDGSVPKNNRVLISSIEHPSIDSVADSLRNRGFDIVKIKVDRRGVVDLSDLADQLSVPTRLVSIMAVNNETGVLQPVKEIARMAKESGALVHTDGVQAIGKSRFAFRDLDVDAMTITAHKIHGPRGIGGLLIRETIKVFPGLFGGFQQQGFRPGTEDVCLTAGFCQAIELFQNQIEARLSRVSDLSSALVKQLEAELDDFYIVGEQVERVPHVINIAFKNVDRQELLMAADLNGLAFSTGSACASGSSDPSPVLKAMQVEKWVVDGAVRLSLSHFNSMNEIDMAARRIIKIVNDLRRRKSSRID